MSRRSSAWAVEASPLLYLTLEELLHVAERVLPQVLVRDIGLLHSALERPRATAFGRDAYPTLELKAAALTHSLVRNHALVDGNKRLGLAALLAFLGINGRRLDATNAAAYGLIVSVATGTADVDAIAAWVAENAEARFTG